MKTSTWVKAKPAQRVDSRARSAVGARRLRRACADDVAQALRWRRRSSPATGHERQAQGVARRGRRRRTARPARRRRRARPPWRSSASRRRRRAARPRRTCRRPALPAAARPAGARRAPPASRRAAPVAGADRRHVLREEAVLIDLVDDALVEARRVQVGRLLGLQQLGEQRRRARSRSRGAGPARAPSRSCRDRPCLRASARRSAPAARRRTRARRTGCPRRSAGRRAARRRRSRRGARPPIERPLGFWKLGST